MVWPSVAVNLQGLLHNVHNFFYYRRTRGIGNGKVKSDALTIPYTPVLLVFLTSENIMVSDVSLVKRVPIVDCG